MAPRAERTGDPIEPTTRSHLTDPLLRWYDAAARDLPWRRPDATPWAVLVSEVMLQQTPVARALPTYASWLERWPTPRALAAEPAGEAVRAWGRLGYPRRALRLHEAARLLVERHDGELPRTVEELRALPGVGAYTAAAVAAFTFGTRVPVVDTNVARVLARVLGGAAGPSRSIGTAQLHQAASLLPDEARAPRWSVAVMELGALVCTARAPRCGHCPISSACAWHRAGCPAGGPGPRAQGYAGTDRQVRGLLLGAVREADRALSAPDLAPLWGDSPQRERALAALVADGLVERGPDGGYTLPGTTPSRR